ncbi:CRISPR-associated endoribonuclease Cas6 [Hymenobacter cheonanensis]|uniref:CRISPR-associated endoribonuclease Cas6 n=1 Tax=Hymenobacter sp. CA2-7 TaxID=3063993 RepID=UPI002713BACA|nr:CRISPR-associated endoribonuclease Cas6 [Hymenobacter sp. CA2-7]MDO7885362.1 CRISPR-associated endoribonuclease Cas6 [Hymenobacter sp. CA2-7]
MRIRFKFASKGGLIPFAYQDALRSVLHRWLGERNLWHGQVRSKFGFSNLLNLRSVGRHGLRLRHGAQTVDWIVGFYDPVPARQMLERGIELRYGFGDLNLVEVQLEAEPLALPHELRVLSPVLVKTLAGNDTPHGLGRWDHLLPSDPDHSEYLTNTFRRKLADVGLDAGSIELRMAEPFQTKLIKIKETLNRCAVSPVTFIGATDEQVRFARDCGIGQSTGCGFGFLE